MGRRLPALTAVAAACAVFAPTAGAHSLVRVNGPTLNYISSDAVSLNDLVVRQVRGEIELRDRAVEGGLDPGPCRPGAITEDANAWLIQVFCPAAGAERVRVVLGDREDAATIAVALPVTLDGGTGADRLTAGGGADSVSAGEGDDAVRGGAGDDQLDAGDGDDRADGGAGRDVIDAGTGVDAVFGGEGDDDVRTRDGLADEVSCGPGTDAVDADTLDAVAADCERITRTPTPPPPDAGSRGDRTPPVLRVGGPTVQRATRRGVLHVLATSTETGTISGSGFLDIGGLAVPITSDRRRVRVAGAGVELTVRLSRRQLRRCRTAWRRGRRVTARLGIVATDRAGNSVRARMPAISVRP